jgi:hypothetical protein
MDPEWKYVTEKDKATTREIMECHLPLLAQIPTMPLFHYTRGETLICIIKNSELWSTQIGCLNDTAEIRYAVDGLLERIRQRRPNLQLEPLLRRLNEVLSDPQLETAPVFVACFSELNDDLSQWRAYSGGEGGYAIRFDSPKLRESGAPNQVLLLRVEYDSQRQTAILDDIVSRAERYYLECEGRQRAPCLEQWAEEFVTFYLSLVNILLPCLKHPAFAAEREWRLVYYYRPDDLTPLQFRQRASMMSRHLPLRLSKPLPISGVTIGPCRYLLLSRTAVSDLLHTHGYTSAVPNVQLSEIPYRAV